MCLNRSYVLMFYVRAVSISYRAHLLTASSLSFGFGKYVFSISEGLFCRLGICVLHDWKTSSHSLLAYLVSASDLIEIPWHTRGFVNTLLNWLWNGELCHTLTNSLTWDLFWHYLLSLSQPFAQHIGLCSGAPCIPVAPSFLDFWLDNCKCFCFCSASVWLGLLLKASTEMLTSGF